MDFEGGSELPGCALRKLPEEVACLNRDAPTFRDTLLRFLDSFDRYGFEPKGGRMISFPMTSTREVDRRDCQNCHAIYGCLFAGSRLIFMS